MAQMTMIARVVDGLPLVGTMQDDEQVSEIGPGIMKLGDHVKVIPPL